VRVRGRRWARRRRAFGGRHRCKFNSGEVVWQLVARLPRDIY
jgi:hypothetical protein